MKYIKDMAQKYIEKYEREAELDLQLDDSLLEQRLQTGTHLWHKWISYRVQHSIIINEKKRELKKLIDDNITRMEREYGDRLSVTKMKYKANSDSRVQELQTEIEDHELIEKYLYEMCGVMKSYQYQIKGLLHFKQYMDGQDDF